MARTMAAVIMAAGKSTRMKSALPKAAHAICGKPMTRYVVDACAEAGVTDVVVVIGHEAERVKSALGDDLGYAYQTEQLGTGHACLQAMPHLRPPCEERRQGETCPPCEGGPQGVITDVLVLPGDTPLITSGELERLIEAHTTEGNAATLLTAVLDDAGHYGRVVRDETGAVVRIVEAKDADPATLAISEINTSIYCFNLALLDEKLSNLGTDNAQGEYYLTDVVQMLRESGRRVGALIAENASDTLGINNRIELAEATTIMRKRILDRLMLSGVTIVDPAATYIDVGVEIAPDIVIHPGAVIEHGSRIG